METANFRKILIDIAQNDSAERVISRVIAYYYPRLDLKDKSTFFDSLMNLLSISEIQNFDFSKLIEEIENNTNIVNPEIFKNKDYRIKNIEISNLRGIPSIQDSDNIPYGINLIEDEICHNAIVLANNGTGKSSIFAGLEMIYGNEIGEKKLRSSGIPNDVEYLKYLRRFPLFGNPKCNIETFDGKYSIENKIFSNEYIKLFNTNSHFITEYDIIENGRIDYETSDQKLSHSFHNIIAKALGLNEFLDLLAITEQIPTYSRRKELNQQSKLVSEIKLNEDTIKNRLALIQSRQIELDELKKGINIDSSTLNKIEIINELRKAIEETHTINSDSTKLKNDIEEFQISYQEYISVSGIQEVSVEKGFLEQGLNLLENKDNCPFCQDSKKSIEEIQKNVSYRIKNLKKYEETERRIKLAYRILSNNMIDSLESLKIIRERLFNQRSILSKQTSLDSLINKEGELMILLTPHLLDDELFNFIKQLSNKQFPTDTEFSSLSNLLIENKELLCEFIPSKISEINIFIKERSQQIQNFIKTLSDSAELTSNDKIKAIEKEINDNKTSIPIIEKTIIDFELQLKAADIQVGKLKKIKDEIKFFNLKLNEEKDRIVTSYFKSIKEVVEKIMNDFIDEKESINLELSLEKIDRNVDGEIFQTEVIMAKIVQKDGKSTTPDIYFNTFRYKVFCLMISLSIALSTRMRYKVNLPLVMDDLFFASDFISKNSFSVFFQKIIELFYKYTPDMPLQFILFTHDDLIFRSALDAIDDFTKKDFLNLHNENKISLSENTFIARMFDINDKDSPTTSNDGNKYWELFYKLPKKISIH
ncbi:hypothetical protein EKL99_02080 [Flavobacterium sp. ZB4P23]|uniref:hypothetical protein n=1 Tax=Flavobacterium sp. ZB4P23 TaxID=2497484 RepID=UPI000F8324C6|nr:hypothetical protein [Flavobacterium sp. ZB4P23]RTY84800.1 hypothetical protein EKL99_02080 [Flavobacterium sp. ZB4P23]